MKRIIAVRRTGGRIDRFEVEYEERTTLLDALERIRTGKEPDLSYRHSCHHGSCGTCAMRVDGKEVLACLTPLSSLPSDEPLVEPLAGFEVAADLAVDPGRLFRSLPEGTTHLRASETSADRAIAAAVEPAPSGPAAQEAERRRVRFEDCIECGCCVSACPVSAEGEAAFRGPAALAAARREGINRPERAAEMLDFAAAEDGAAKCERHISCSKVCPRAVYPAKHIELLRKELSGR